MSTHTIIHKQVYKTQSQSFHSLLFLSYSRFLDCNVPINSTRSPQDESHIQNDFTSAQNTSHICPVYCYNIKTNQPPVYPSRDSNTRFGTIHIPQALTMGNCLLKSPVTMSRVAYFIPRAQTTTTKTLKSREMTGGNESEWTRKTQIQTRKKLPAAGEVCAATKIKYKTKYKDAHA